MQMVLTLMSNRYFQVARTYLRWAMLPTVGLTAAYFLFLYVGYVPATKPQRLVYLAVLMWLTAWSSGLLATHVKAQFADARALVTPRYRMPHLLIGIIAMLAVSLGCAVLATPKLAFAPAGVIALTLAVAASSAWWGQLQNNWVALVCNVLWLSLLNHGVLFAVGAMLEANNAPLPAAIIVLSGAALIALWIRQAWMREGMGEYHRRFFPDTPHRPRPIAATAGDGWIESFLRRPIETRCIAAANLWARARHLRATGLGRMPWLMGAILAVSMLLLPVIGQNPGADHPAVGAMEGMIFIVMILPSVVTISHWARRWPALGYESLRPTSRDRFLRELGLAIAMDLAEAFVVMLAGALIPLAIWMPGLPGVLWHNGFFPLAIATAGAMFAINAWFLRLRNAPLGMFVMGLTALAPIVPVLMSFNGRRADMNLPLSLGLFVLAGLVISDAYARWRRTDLA